MLWDFETLFVRPPLDDDADPGGSVSGVFAVNLDLEIYPF